MNQRELDAVAAIMHNPPEVVATIAPLLPGGLITNLTLDRIMRWWITEIQAGNTPQFEDVVPGLLFTKVIRSHERVTYTDAVLHIAASPPTVPLLLAVDGAIHAHARRDARLYGAELQRIGDRPTTTVRLVADTAARLAAALNILLFTRRELKKAHP